VAYAQERAHRAELAEALEANRRSVELAKQRYAQGLAAYLDVLDAERALYASQDAAVLSERRISEHVVALYKALGGGWDAEFR
jgi:outer membrane protein TolC